MIVEYKQTGIVSVENGNVLVDGNTLQSAILEFPSKFEDGKKTFPGTVKIVVEGLTSSGKFSTEKDGEWTF